MRRDLTSGSISGNILSLAWPTAVAMLLQTAFNVVDAIFLGRISAGAIAAVTIVFPAVFLMFAFSAGIGVGTTSLIARCLGSHREKTAHSAASHAFVLAAAMSLFFCWAGLTFQKSLFPRIGADAGTLPLVLQYSTWIFGGSVFLFFGTAAASILRAEGDMRTPMRVMVISVLLNAVLDPLLIFGIGFFPRLEVTGAGIATFIARAVGCVLLLACVFGGRTSVKVRFRGIAYDGAIVRSILRVGVPTSANQVIMSLSFMFFNTILGAFGTDAIAAYGLVIRLNQIVILPCLGIATAVITIVGQNVGARKFDRAESTAWRAALYAIVIMEAVGVMFFLMPRPFMRVFTAEGQVIAYGVSCLRIVSLTYMFIGVSIIMGSAFQGAGKGLPALVITALRLLILAVPGAYALSRPFGLNGVWMAMAASTVIASIVSAIWFKSGTWKHLRPA